MPKNFSGGFPGGNMNNLVKQAQKMQRQMLEAQEALADKIIDVTAGGGAIEISISCSKEIKSIKIDKDVVDPDDVEMLQDLILTAVNEALRQAEEISGKEMSKFTGGMNLPGMF